MKYSLRCWILSALLLTITFLGYGQSPKFGAILSQLESKATSQPVERIYIQHDKPFYALHETIWLKAYLTIAPFNQLSGHSKILYVDLIDARDSLMQQLRLPVLAGVAEGAFTLDESWQEGTYRIRSYTQWMRNFDEDGFFENTVLIGSANTSDIQLGINYTSGGSEIITNIELKDLENRPLFQTRVDYEVFYEEKGSTKGSFVTGQDGTSHFNFPAIRSGKSPKTILFNIVSGDQKVRRKHLPVLVNEGVPKLSFFPEGGHLIAGMEAKLGFKALHPNGKGIAASGQILTAEGVVVTDFKTSHLGMGHVVFTPEANQKYVANILFENEESGEVFLPEIQPIGYGIRMLESDASTMSLQLYVSQELVKNQPLGVVIQQHGNVFFAGEVAAKSSLIPFKIPTEDFPTGVCQITLFDTQQRPVSERMAFYFNPLDVLPIELSTSSSTYETFDKVNVQILAGQPSDASRQMALSAAVVEEGVLNLDSASESSIFDQLWLGSEIKGYLEDGSYYFNPQNIERLLHLDNLMLTQGWRKLDWTSLGLSDQDMRYAPESSIQLSGRVVNDLNRKAIPNNKVQLFPGGDLGMSFMKDTITDQEGRFSFDHLKVFGPTGYLLQSQVTGKSPFRLVLDAQPDTIWNQGKNQPDRLLNLHEHLHRFLNTERDQLMQLENSGIRQKTILLDEIAISTRYTPKKLEYSHNLNGPGRADRIVMGADVGNFLQTSDVLASYGMSGYILVDGIEVSNEMLDVFIKPNEIGSIEFLRSMSYTAVYQHRTPNVGPVTQVILITSRPGGSNVNIHAPNLVWQSVKGFDLPRVFYTPDYDLPDADKSLDFRGTTIHWQPQLTTNSEGVASFSFHTAGRKTSYRILVEGVGIDGRLTRAIKNINVL